MTLEDGTRRRLAFVQARCVLVRCWGVLGPGSKRREVQRNAGHSSFAVCTAACPVLVVGSRDAPSRTNRDTVIRYS